MTKHYVTRWRAGLLLAALATIGAIAAYAVAGASAQGRTLEGNFCGFSHTCMTITFGGITAGTPTRTDPTQPDMALRPGTYWISGTDNSNAHNFSLRSCPGSTSLCTAANPAATTQDITPVCNDPLTSAGKCPTTTPAANAIDETLKLDLTHGTYRLYCAAPGHERGGMYVDLTVGGEGQVG